MSDVPMRSEWARGAVGEPPPRFDNDTTRYLCAAAHLNPEFARRTVRELLVAEQRFPAASHPIDLVTVARHCIAARSRRLYLDVILCAAVLVAAAFSPWATLAWITGLAGLWLLLRAAGAADGAARFAFRLLALLWIVLGLVALSLIATGADPFSLRTVWQLPLHGSNAALSWIGTPLAALVACWLAVTAAEVAEYVTVVDHLRRDGFTPGRWLSAEPAWAQHALGVLGERLADGRLVHHPVLDPATPFLGAGRQVLRRRWLVEPGPAAAGQSPFDTADLLDRICERLAEGFGGLDTSGSARRPGDVLIDQCAVSTAPALATRGVHDAIRLLPDAPGAGGRSDGPRVFRRVRVGGDPTGSTVTAFLNASAGAGLLQFEIYGYVLGPVAARYRIADHATPFGWIAALRCLIRAGQRLPATVFAAPREVARTAGDPVRRRRSRVLLSRAAAAGLTVAAGARFDVREAVADAPGANVFADEDANLHLAVIERRVREELRPLLPPGSTEF